MKLFANILRNFRQIIRRSWRYLPSMFVFVFSVSCYADSLQATAEEIKKISDLRLMAIAYEHGEGVSKDIGKAISLYCEGAVLGDAEAQFNLAWIYANARSVKRDDALAAYLFGLAKKQGHQQAANMLALLGDTAPIMPDCMREAMVETEMAFVPTTAAQKKVADLVYKLAPGYGVNPRLVLAVIRVESNFDVLAHSPRNAQGVMQLIPETAARFQVKRPFDPEQNIRGGLAYLRWLLAYFKGNVSYVAAAYNAGEGAVDRYRGIPPYPETRSYVKGVTALYGGSEHAYNYAVTEPSCELFADCRNGKISP